MKKIVFVLGFLLLFTAVSFAGVEKPIYEKVKKVPYTVSISITNNLDVTISGGAGDYNTSVNSGTTVNGSGDYETTEGCTISGHIPAAAYYFHSVVYVNVYADGSYVTTLNVLPGTRPGIGGLWLYTYATNPSTSVSATVYY
jgi:hypothetical protein